MQRRKSAGGGTDSEFIEVQQEQSLTAHYVFIHKLILIFFKLPWHSLDFFLLFVYMQTDGSGWLLTLLFY